MVFYFYENQEIQGTKWQSKKGFNEGSLKKGVVRIDAIYADSAGVVSYLMIMVLLLAESDPFTLELDWSSTSIGASLSSNAALEVDIPEEEIVNELPVEREEFDVAAGPSRASPPVSDFFPLTISSSTRSICKCSEDGTVLAKQPERVAIYYCVKSYRFVSIGIVIRTCHTHSRLCIL